MNSVRQIISLYRKKAGLSQIELAEKLNKDYGLNLSAKNISSWENGRAEPSIGTFLCICRALGIPDCIEIYFGDNPANPLSQLNDAGKDLVQSYVDSLIHPTNYLKAPNIIPFAPSEASAASKKMKQLRLFDTRVSAGTGSFLDSDDYTTFDIDEEQAGDADFAVTISGDSMEPEFHNHEMVLVHQQDTLEDGEIGIFALNDSAYIKKFQSDRTGTFLVSLNTKYEPIPVHPETDFFRIFGKVRQISRYSL